MKDNESNPELKTAFDSILNDLIDKDSLYEPMKQLRELFPDWLEKNAESLPMEDVDRYND